MKSFELALVFISINGSYNTIFENLFKKNPLKSFILWTFDKQNLLFYKYGIFTYICDKKKCCSWIEAIVFYLKWTQTIYSYINIDLNALNWVLYGINWKVLENPDPNKKTYSRQFLLSGLVST